MSKAPRISPSVKILIYKAALSDREKDRRLLAVEIREKLNKLDIGTIPAEETLQKMISWARNNSSDPEDRPWSVSALADYDIPPGALPIIIKAWAFCMTGDIRDGFLSIRMVKWMARLYSILDDVERLLTRAGEYAFLEQAIKLTGAYPAKPQNMHWLWFYDAWLYLDVEGRDIELVKNLMVTHGVDGENWEDLKECINIPVQREEFRREFVDEELIEAIKNSINEESQNERPHNQEG